MSPDLGDRLRIPLRIPSLRRPRRRTLVRAGGVLLCCAACWFGALRLDPPPDPYEVRPPGLQVRARDGTLLRGFLTPDEQWRWRLTLDEVHPRLLEALLHHEDRRFRSHVGVDPLAMVRALFLNVRAGRVVSGGSTLTMQLARLTEPRPRTVGAKLYQVYRALQYECRHSKDEILEMYLNLAPYGSNVEGVAAAAWTWCGKAPAELSASEAALLAVIPESPTRRSPVKRPEAARAARDALLARLDEDGVWDPETVAAARRRDLPGRRFRLPARAPHLADRLRVLNTGADRIRSTIDPVLQSDVEAVLGGHVRRLRTHGIDQAAAVVLDAPTGQVLALVGSADFWDAAGHGQVDGAHGLRSPGSTLKPFVYALAYDRGLAAPSTLLEDVPVRYGDYAPRNYDGAHRGVVAAGEALAASLNVPAVTLTARLKREHGVSLRGVLERAGAASLSEADEYYGLSLVLGGGDVTLVELATLYGMLARQGTALPSRLTLDEPSVEPVRLVSPEACWLVLQDLEEVERPDLDMMWRVGSRAFPVPWKTGTSYGHRDAWSVGVAGRSVVAVWTGNFDGRGVPELVGAHAAAPLLFDLVATLPQGEAGTWHMRPERIVERRVCVLSGAPAGEHCPVARTAYAISGLTPAAACRIHRRVAVDSQTGSLVCPRCRVEGRWEERTVVWWPPALAAFTSGITGGLPTVPPHEPTCPAFAGAGAPRILEPADGTVYVLRRGVPLQDQAVPLSAWADAGASDLWWFVDGTLLGRATTAAPLFWLPDRGEHEIRVIDAQGRSATAEVVVR